MSLLLAGCGNVEGLIRGYNAEMGNLLPAPSVTGCNEPASHGAENSKVAQYRTAAEQGDATAQKELGLLYYNGQCVPKSHLDAAQWFAKAAEHGLAAGQYNLGYLYRNGYGVAKDPLSAYFWFALAAAQHDAEAAHELNSLEAEMTPAQLSIAQSRASAWPKAEQGDANAQFLRGALYAKGIGVMQDYAEAIRWLQKSAEQGNALAENALGYAYYHGRGVPKDCTEALKWLQKAADQSQVNAQTTLGWFYYKGECVSRNPAKALQWSRLAASRGFAEAQNNLGELYEHGDGVAKNPSEAVKWYRLAAEHNNASGQINLGHRYAEGRGVKRDYVTAYLWTALATRHDKAHVPDEHVLETARNALSELMHKMTYDQIIEGKKQADAWRPSIDTPGDSSRITGTTDSGKNNKQQRNTEPTTDNQPYGTITIPVKAVGTTYEVPVTINNTLTLDFMVDSGCSTVAIPEDVLQTLMRTGTLQKTDSLGEVKAQIADGSVITTQTYNIKTLRVGGVVIKDVTVGVTPTKGSLLLGIGFLGRFSSWSIDNMGPSLILHKNPNIPIREEPQ